MHTPNITIVVYISILAVLAGADRTVKFGISLSLVAPTPQYVSRLGTQQQCEAGLVIWRDWFNNLPAASRSLTLVGNATEPLLVELVIMEDYFGNSTLWANYYEMANRSDIDFLFAPCGTPQSHPLMDMVYAEFGREIMMGALDSTERWYAHKGAFGSSPSSLKYLLSVLPYLRLSGVKTVTVVRSADLFQSEICSGFLANAKLHDVEVKNIVYTRANYFPIADSGPEAIANMTGAVDQAVAADNEGVVICDYGNAQQFILEQFRNRTYSPKIIVASFSVPLSDPTLSEYLVTMSSFSERANYPPQPTFGDIREFAATVREKTNTNPTSSTAQATLGGMLFTNAILVANSLNESDVYRALERSEFSSFLGVASFDFFHRQLLQTLVLQQVNQTQQVVGPSLAASSELVFPFPRWEEREFIQRWGSPSEIVAAVLIGVGVACSLFWVGFVVYHWNSKAIRAASPVFLLALLFGSVLCYISIFTWMPGLVNEHICRARAWLLPSGYIVLYGSLIAKTFRIDRLNRSAGLKVIAISDGKVALVIVLLYVVQAIISILMTSVPQLTSEMVVVDPHRPVYNYNTCTFDTPMIVLMSINIVYGGILMLWGSYLAYRVRTIPYSIYDESKVIVFSIYNTAFFAVLVIIIRLAFPQHLTDLIFILTAVFTFLGGTVTTTVLFVSKLVYLRNRPASGTDGRVATTLSVSSRNETQMQSVYMHGSAASVFAPSKQGAQDESSTNEESYKDKYRAMKKRAKELEKELARVKAEAKEEAEGDDDGDGSLSNGAKDSTQSE